MPSAINCLIARHIRLKITVTGVGGLLTPALECPQRTHTPVVLELFPVDKHQVARALIGSREQ